MIPFFRKIRYRLAKDNQFLKYSRYAIGEIILVVIGILIALQINNWNEKQKSQKRTNLLLEKTQKELLYNIERCNLVIDFYRRKDSLLYNVLNQKVTYEDYKNGGKYMYLITVYESANLVNEAFNILIENDTELLPKQESIILNLKGLYGTEKNGVDEMDIKTASLVNNFLDKLKDEKNWYFRVDNNPPEEEVNYYLKDSFYLNEVSHFETYAFRNHLPNATEFKRKATSIYEEISDYLDLKKDSSVVKNMNDYKHYLGVYEYDSLHNFQIIQENKTLKINYSAKNETVILDSSHIYPESKEYFMMESIYGQFIFDKNDEVIKMAFSNGSRRDTFKKID